MFFHKVSLLASGSGHRSSVWWRWEGLLKYWLELPSVEHAWGRSVNGLPKHRQSSPHNTGVHGPKTQKWLGHLDDATVERQHW